MHVGIPNFPASIGAEDDRSLFLWKYCTSVRAGIHTVVLQMFMCSEYYCHIAGSGRAGMGNHCRGSRKHFLSFDLTST
jgi:hypothetical protein